MNSLADILTPFQFDNVNQIVGNLADASGNLLRATEEAPIGAFSAALAALPRIAAELKRLNDNLQAGTLNMREHHPRCIAPIAGDYTIRELEIISKYAESALAEGRLVLPPREGDEPR